RGEPRDADLDGRGRLIAEQAPGLGDVGIGAQDIAGLHGQALERGCCPKRVGDQLDQARERGRPALALKGALDRIEICAIGLDQAKSRVIERTGKVLALLLGRIERIKVVDADHPIPARQEPLDEVASDEARRAGYQYGNEIPKYSRWSRPV